MGDHGRAIEDYVSALLRSFLRPDPEVFAYSCRAQNELGEIQKAIFQCNRAIDLNPESGTGYRHRGDGSTARASIDAQPRTTKRRSRVTAPPSISTRAMPTHISAGRLLTQPSATLPRPAATYELAVEHGASQALLEHEISIRKGRGLAE